MITSPLFFPCRLLKKRRDDLVGTTMFTAFLLSSSEIRVPILSAVPLTNLNALKSLLPHYGTEHQLFGVKYFWRGATKAGNRRETNQLCCWDQLWSHHSCTTTVTEWHYQSTWALCPKCPKGSQENCNTDQRCLGIVPVVSHSHKALRVFFVSRLRATLPQDGASWAGTQKKESGWEQIHHLLGIKRHSGGFLFITALIKH